MSRQYGRTVFFFQAEDGIRDYKVTGVQTCALPISAKRKTSIPSPPRRKLLLNSMCCARAGGILPAVCSVCEARISICQQASTASSKACSGLALNGKIGRASCRERVEISVVAVSLKKKQ